jgi:Tfp pilus assembly protein PilV
MNRSRLSDARGFAMVEAIVAAMLLVIVALGVLKGLETAQTSSGREKARSTAAALTEQDQERMRSFRAVDLDNYDEVRTLTVNNVSYTVTSRVDWVRDSTGGTQSCNNSASQADYMRLTSTTTSNLVNTPIKPITLSSLVAPPVGAFGTNQGTLGIQVNDRDGVGVPNINVSIAGPTNITNATNDAGCAIFAYVPVGSYTASLNSAGWVDQGGVQNTSVGATVSNGTVNVKSLIYDQAASVDATFDTEPLTGTSATSVPATTTQLSAANASVPSGPFAPFAGERVFDPTGGALGTISATGLFPFKDGYNLYGGGCPGADPTKYDPDYFTTLGGNAVVATDPGAASPLATVRLPSINLRVLYNSAPLAATYLTSTRIVVYSIGTNCSEKFIFPAPSTDANGYMLFPALPFGPYKVCAESKTPASPSTPKSKTLNPVNNFYYRGIKPAADPSAPASPVIDLNGATSGACP